MSKILIDEATVKLALGALNELVAQTEIGLFAVRHDHVAMQDARQAITALREALAEHPATEDSSAAQLAAQQEPKAWMNPNASFVMDAFIWTRDEQNHPEYSEPVYTTPQPAQRTWIGLTPEQSVDLYKATETDNRMVLIDAVDATLRELNT